MKKVFNVFLSMLLLITCFIPYMPVVSAEDCTYEVAKAYSDKDERLSCHATYDSANAAMIAFESNENVVSVIKYNGKIINAEYALVNMDRGDVTTNLYDEANFVNIPDYHDTYVHGQWGVDAAFLGYNDQYKAVKIMISGYTGYARSSQVTVIPISKFINSKLKINGNDCIKVREQPNTNSPIHGCLTKGEMWDFYPSQTINNGYGGYTWYKIKHTSGDRYIASLGENWVSVVFGTNIGTYYYTSNNIIYHYIRTNINGVNRWGDSNLKLGTAPFKYDSSGVMNYYLLANTNYYSFDGNYFYNDVLKMLDDYKNSNYNNAINIETPYFNYFMYLPTRSRTGYSASALNQIVVNRLYSAKPTDSKSYVSVNEEGYFTGWTKSRIGLSQMYGMGEAFISSQNTYGVNALQSFTAALTESGTGTSEIAFYKNNLFGLGAGDGDAFRGAKVYTSVEESIMKYAEFIGSASTTTSYLDPSYKYFAGSNQGNKGSGINRWYASNPYSGEQHAKDAYSIDLGYGGLENYSNTLGIKLGRGIYPIYKQPNTSSPIIYYTKNHAWNVAIPNLPYIVTDKVYDANGKGFYKIQTDYSLDDTQKIVNAQYDFDYSYGYISEEYLYVQNSQPVITASNITFKQDDTEEHRKSIIESNATATDLEDGILTEIIYDDSNVKYDTKGTYKLKYTTKDKSNFSATKEVSVEITDPGAPMLLIPEVEVSQYTAFDPWLNVQITDPNPESLEKTVTGTVDTDVIGTYILTYSVTNMYNKTTTMEGIVKVITNESPVINAVSRTITQFDSIDLMSGVTATDKESGDLTSRITIEGTVDTSIVGDYSIVYKVLDDANQETSKTITITVEGKKYTAKGGVLHLEKLKYNDSTKLLDFAGFLKVDGVEMNSSTDIKYDMILQNQYDDSIKIIGLNRWVSEVPFTTGGCGYAWFKASINLDEIEEGDYTIYIRARTGEYETKQLLKNTYFNKDISSKITNNGRGYLFRTDYSNRNIPLELFVRDEGLISTAPKSILYNMYNQYYSMSFNGTTFNLKGVSHSIGGNYGVDQTITRELVIENIATLERVKTIDIGSTTDKKYDVTLKIPDGYDKTRAWYNVSLDISDLDKGSYSIYLRTKTGDIDDYGEIYDYLFNTINASTTYEKEGTTYKAKVIRNNNKRFRLELIIE